MVRYSLLCVGAACTAQHAGIDDIFWGHSHILASGRNLANCLKPRFSLLRWAQKDSMVGLILTTVKELPYELGLALVTANPVSGSPRRFAIVSNSPRCRAVFHPTYEFAGQLNPIESTGIRIGSFESPQSCLRQQLNSVSFI